jgi:hypothetical protein
MRQRFRRRMTMYEADLPKGLHHGESCFCTNRYNIHSHAAAESRQTIIARIFSLVLPAMRVRELNGYHSFYLSFCVPSVCLKRCTFLKATDQCALPFCSKSLPNRRAKVCVQHRVRLVDRQRSPLACTQKPTCSTCAGDGIIICPVCTGAGVLGRTIPCPYCKGRKQISCPACVEDVYEASWEAETDEPVDAELQAMLPPSADARVRGLYRSHLEALRRERRDKEPPAS